MITSKHKQGGFTLLEVVLAFLIFSIAFGALLEVMTGAMRNNLRSKEYTEATLWAQTKLDATGVGEPLEEGHESGEFDDIYRWEMDIRPYEVAGDEDSPFGENALELVQIDLDVSWHSRGGDRHARFSTLKIYQREQ